MSLPSVIVVGGLTALAIGYVIRSWWLFLGAFVIGVVTIIIDVSTRNLIGAGHDDRGLVAMSETMLLIGFELSLAIGIVIGHVRADRAAAHRARKTDR
ncbi:MAG: hypothetical protein QOJ25_593 [Solirubrobacteraceae bacterium]|jgi:hypothetical protein|nr:hypothetical protein [Solirubrobacteraceae bacterium]